MFSRTYSQYFVLPLFLSFVVDPVAGLHGPGVPLRPGGRPTVRGGGRPPRQFAHDRAPVPANGASWGPSGSDWWARWRRRWRAWATSYNWISKGGRKGRGLIWNFFLILFLKKIFFRLIFFLFFRRQCLSPSIWTKSSPGVTFAARRKFFF